MTTQPLTTKYRSSHLKDVYGQDFITRYFQSVIRRPSIAVKSHVLIGPFGCGKTSIARAFAVDLFDLDHFSQLEQQPRYIELDPLQVSDRARYAALKDWIFSPVPGYKVVVFDEAHLIDPSVQDSMLKDIEESTQIFFFFLSTVREGIIDTIFSRSIDFTLEKFSDSLMLAYLDAVLESEKVELSAQTREMLILRAAGHVRNLLNQLQLVLTEGEEEYLTSYVDIVKMLDRYFKKDEAFDVQELMSVPFSFLKRDLEYFILEKIVKGKQYFSLGQIPKVFSFYLRVKRYVASEIDFFSFLVVFREFFTSLK